MNTKPFPASAELKDQIAVVIRPKGNPDKTSADVHAAKWYVSARRSSLGTRILMFASSNGQQLAEFHAAVRDGAAPAGILTAVRRSDYTHLVYEAEFSERELLLTGIPRSALVLEA
jgi:hypothetical protein